MDIFDNSNKCHSHSAKVFECGCEPQLKNWRREFLSTSVNDHAESWPSQCLLTFSLSAVRLPKLVQVCPRNLEESTSPTKLICQSVHHAVKVPWNRPKDLVSPFPKSIELAKLACRFPFWSAFHLLSDALLSRSVPIFANLVQISWQMHVHPAETYDCHSGLSCPFSSSLETLKPHAAESYDEFFPWCGESVSNVKNMADDSLLKRISQPGF